MIIIFSNPFYRSANYKLDTNINNIFYHYDFHKKCEQLSFYACKDTSFFSIHISNHAAAGVEPAIMDRRVVTPCFTFLRARLLRLGKPVLRH